MSFYKYDASTNTYVLVDESALLGIDPSLANISIATDLSDYAPGSTANFTATVGVGDTVTFNVADVAGVAVSGTNQPWTVTDGGPGDLDGVANGVIQTSWAVGMDAAGEAFVLSATDQNAGIMVTTSFTDSPHTPVPAVVPPSLTNGIVFLTGDTNTSTGTGIFPSFIQIQAKPQEGGVEQAFNTDAAPVEDSGSSPDHNHSLLLSAVPIVTINGVDYREFRLDLNEQVDSISLDKLQIYSATAGNLTSLAGLTQIYDMDGGPDGKTGGGDDVNVSVGLTAWSSGSGHSDYKVLIPNSYFAGTDPGTYLYLYSQFSNAEAGFEEWSVGPASPTGTPKIAIDKVTVDGTLDANGNLVSGAADDGLTIIAGENILWEYKVTNTGNVALSNVTVTDNQGVTPTSLLNGDGFNVGDSNEDGKLDTNETWIYTAAGTAIDGAYSNTGTASGSFTDSAGHSTTSTASDDSGYTGVTPAINIDKVTVDGTLDANGNLVSGAAGDDLIIIAGEKILWEYKVTNAGDVALSDVTVTDNQGVTPASLLNGDAFNVGDSNEDGKLDTNETWIYTAAGTAVDGAYNNTGTASGSFTDSAGHTKPVTASDGSGYTGVTPAIHIEKVTTGVDSATVVNGVVTTHTATGDGLSFLAGYGVSWTYTVTNAGDVSLSDISVTDDQSGVTPTAVLQGGYNVGDANHNGLLDVGESWIYTASGIAILGNYSNTGTATGSFTDTALHTVNPTASDPSWYTGTFTEQGGTLTQGFWGSHTDAWDGASGKESNPTKSAYNSGVLSALDINPRHDGYLLLGDANGNGKADAGESTLLISDTLAASILSSSTTGDARVIMLQQTIAAQLNIDNGKVEPNDLIGEAVKWLTGKDAWSGNGFTVDANNDGYVDMSGNKLAGSAVSTSGNAWQKFVDVTDPSTGIADWNGGKEADGEGLKNALMWWNDGHLVTSTSGQVAYDTNGTAAGGINPATVNLNTLDEFWGTLHQQASLTGIA